LKTDFIANQYNYVLVLPYLSPQAGCLQAVQRTLAMECQSKGRQPNSQGSIWHTWDSHIHAPGTILNDQFSGEDALEQFLSKIERSDPRIRALGITDYYSLDVYEIILEKKKKRPPA
jgi:hypothetical protein